MVSEGSLTHTQVRATRHYPEPARSNPYPASHFLKIHLNIILPSTSGSPKWSPSLSPPNQNPVSIRLSSPPYTLHAQLISFFSILSPENYWVSSTDHWTPHYVVSSTPLLPLLSLRPKYSPQHPILKHPQPSSSLSVSDQVSCPYITADKNILCIS